MENQASQSSGIPERRVETRIERLEEAHLFAERRVDDLEEQVLALEQKLRETIDRMRTLEARLVRLGEGLNDGDGPAQDEDLP